MPQEFSQSVESTNWLTTWSRGWDAFWFRQRDPATLGLIRILTGALAFYNFLVWTRGMNDFLGPAGMLPPGFRQSAYGSAAWSHLDWFHSPAMMWAFHGLAMFVAILVTLGLFTRITTVLLAALVISYANRATGALFGFDQILGFLCLYLAIGDSGGAFSLDRWWRRRKDDPAIAATVNRSTTTNLAIRLMQVHLCVVYLFAGLGKIQGESWWNGQAIWYSLASFEYQTMDLTWLAEWMWLVNLLTLLTVAWEVGYAALVWPRMTRPVILLLAVPLHLGIGMAMGMMTFGLVMLVANLAFVESTTVRRLIGRVSGS